MTERGVKAAAIGRRGTGNEACDGIPKLRQRLEEKEIPFVLARDLRRRD